MKTDIKIGNLKTQFQKILKMEAKHAAFIGIMIVLLAYLFMVLRISQLSSSDAQAAEITASTPKIDANAIKQIQNLEQQNAQVRSLFNDARNNPFQE
jgi:hypothetical protein